MKQRLILLLTILAMSAIVVCGAVRTPRTTSIFNRSNDLIFSVNDKFGGRDIDSNLRGDIIFQTGDFLAPTECVRILSNGNVGIGTTNPTAIFHVVGLPTHADEATASANGLTAGAIYKTATGELRVKL